MHEEKTTYELLSSETHNNNVALYKCWKGKECFYKKVAFSEQANQLIENEKRGYDWFCRIAEKEYEVNLTGKNFLELQIPEFTGKTFPRSAPIRGNENEIEMIIEYYKKKWLRAKEFAIHGDLALCNNIIELGRDLNIVDWEHFHFTEKEYFGFDIFNMLFISLNHQFKHISNIDSRTKMFLKSCYKYIVDNVPASNKILEKPFQNSNDYLQRNKRKFRVNVNITNKFVLAKYSLSELEKLDLFTT